VVRRAAVLLGALLVVAIAVGIAVYYVISVPSGVTWQAGKSFIITEEEAAEMLRAPPSSAAIFTSNNTIVFTSKDVRIVAFATHMEDLPEWNITAPFVPSYVPEHGMVFVIYGLINPTITVPSGARINVTIINIDEDMVHNLVITSSGPPYPQAFGADFPFLTKMDFLQFATEESVYGYWYTVTLPSGSYWYLCQVPGHAVMGMYGQMISR